jgi:ABC-type bacteriocin/lantibiotic exporter with double-glycine peptidase domain
LGNDGAGKTTLLKLLTGAYPHFNGSMLVNGVPIGNYNLQSLRYSIGIFMNQQDIFAGTLWDNIAMGNETVQKETVLLLLQQTGLQPFLASLKQGFDTELSPTGKRLPRNVVQKILLVRALANKPKMLLLDEPWNGVEEQSKLAIQHLLLEQLPDTTVVIATNDAAFATQCHQQVHLAVPTLYNQL